MIIIIHMMLLLIFILLSVAFFSLFERKMMSIIQYRKGPNKVGKLGLLQPIVDAIKLVSKLESIPSSSKLIYLFSPLLMFSISSMMWVLYPFFVKGWSIKLDMILLMVLFSISVYGLIMSGWYSNSNFSKIGCVRALSQSISYEIGLSFGLLIFMLLMSSIKMNSFMMYQNYSKSFIIMMFPMMICLMIMFLAELNRTPFDLAEGESELVSGYSVEYGGLGYTLIFLSENLSLLWMSMLMGILFDMKLIPMIVYFMVLIRSTFARIRFDKMMILFWMLFLPMMMNMSVMYISII